jgi:phage baseplate assembly protein W
VAIKLTDLQTLADQYSANSSYTYEDLHLDFEVSSVFNTTLRTTVPGNDIKTDWDENAIKNSLNNLFNTRPGQRFLFPKYGLNFNQFLFDAITESNARVIGETIYNGITNYEPRVTVLGVNVEADPDNNRYNISIILQLPLLGTQTTLNTILNTRTQSFTFVNTPQSQ